MGLQVRPDLIRHLKFASLIFSLIAAKIDDIIKANNLLRKAKQKIVFFLKILQKKKSSVLFASIMYL